MEINGYTRMAAVVAQPIKHSLSPFIHNLAFELTNENGVYLAWEVESEDLGAIIENVKRLNMYGVNISMPYKRDVIDFVDYLTDEARLIGAVNTVVNFDGELIGHNTDGIGFFKALDQFDFDVKNQTMTMIGGGGAAIAIIAQAALLGVKKINVLARRSQSFEPLSARLEKLSALTETEILLTDLSVTDEIQKQLTESQLLVNATSVGMDGESQPLPNELRLSEHCLVVDAIYKVPETPFLRWAKAQGATTANGLGMLLYQAAASFEMWTGKKMPTNKIEQKLRDKIHMNKGDGE